MEDYDFTLQYHPGKANVVADALSRRSRGILACLAFEDWSRSRTIVNYDLQYYEDCNKAFVYNLVATPSLLERVKQGQWQDEDLREKWRWIQNNEQLEGWEIRLDRLTKSAHFIPIKVTYKLDKLSRLYVDWIVRLHGVLITIFSYNNSYQSSIGMAPYEALYGRPCRSLLCWLEKGEQVNFPMDYVEETTDKIKVIKERLKAAQSRQKSYVDVRQRPLQFDVGDYVFLKVTPRRGVARFGVKGKLAPRYIGPFEILSRVGEVAYRLALPPQLGHVHNVFHVSMLRKSEPNVSHVIQWDEVPIQEDATNEEMPLQILGWKLKVLRKREIPLVKVLWQHHGIEDSTWELESEILEHYPHLFSS
ncbi:hypothetical protein UlMin_000189 [Ulmus minor]